MWQCDIQSRKIECGQARARNPLQFNLLSTSPEFFIDQNQFLFEVSNTVSQYRIA